MIRIAQTAGIVLMLASVITFGIGIYFYASTKSFLRTAVRTQGTVLEVLRERTRDGTTTYRPTFFFIDQHRQEHRIPSRLCSNPPRFETGQTVSLVYDPDDPMTVTDDSIISVWFGFVFCGITSASFLSMGLLLRIVCPIIIRRAK